jgi:hypothetical protein
MSRVACVVVLGAMAWGCGDTTSTPKAMGGQATSGGAGVGATGEGGKPATPSGGVAGSAGSGDDEPPIVVAEADPDEPCTPDPLADQWQEDVIDYVYDMAIPQLGVGGSLVIMAYNDAGTLRARLFDATAWSEPLAVEGATDVEQLERVEVSRDGSGALLIWRSESGLFGTWYTKANGFQPPQALPVEGEFHVAMLSGARAVLGFANGDGANAVELSASDGAVERSPVFVNYDGLFNWGEDAVAAFSASSFVAGPDAMVPFEVGVGFGAKQELPLRQVMPSSWQSFFRSFHNGRAARVIRVNQAGVQGLHVTTLQGDGWGSEERINQTPGDALFEPLVADVGASLVVSWYDNDARHGVVREHDGTAWRAENVLPRARSFVPRAIAGGRVSAVVAGEQNISAENVGVKKLYRRGEEGTWYCAKLLPNAVGGSLSGDGASFWYMQRVRETLSISRFRAE